MDETKPSGLDNGSRMSREATYGSERGWGETPWATHLLMVFSCVNGNKPTNNVRYSTTPIGERLTDNYVSGLLSGITKAVMQITGA